MASVSNEILFKIINWEQWKHKNQHQEHIFSFSEGYDKNLSFLFLNHGTLRSFAHGNKDKLRSYNINIQDIAH